MLSEKPETDYSPLLDLLGIPDTHNDFLGQAFVTRKYAEEIAPQLEHNHNLALLGDAVLRQGVVLYLVRTAPLSKTDVLTPITSIVVSTATLAEIGEQLGLERYLRHGHKEGLLFAADHFERFRVYAETLEAVIGAIYLQHSAAALEPFYERHIIPYCQRLLRQPMHSLMHPKSLLQKMTNNKWGKNPRYVSQQSRTDRHVFLCECSIGTRIIGKGTGPAKKVAETNAAFNGLHHTFAADLAALEQS